MCVSTIYVGLDTCSSWGSIVLRGGSGILGRPGGRVEMCDGAYWRVVCDVEWTNEDASVVCGQLGYSKQSMWYNPCLP